MGTARRPPSSLGGQKPLTITERERALLKEGLPKDVRSGLLREPVTHWNLILPQIICYIVVLKVLKLQIEWSIAYLFFNLALS